MPYDLTIDFICPHCNKLHTKRFDSGVWHAIIYYTCQLEYGGCGTVFKLFYWPNGEVQWELVPKQEFRMIVAKAESLKGEVFLKED